MKYLIASDLHGSVSNLEKLLKIFDQEKTDKLILLGDLYYHGPRNPLPDEYNPAKVAEKLNNLKEQLIVIKGNCDSEVDEMISQFDFLPNLILNISGKTIFLTHGHKINQNNPPKFNFDILIYGHEHTGYIKAIGDKLFINAGSISLPKNNTPKSYIIINSDKLMLKDLDGQILLSTNI